MTELSEEFLEERWRNLIRESMFSAATASSQPILLSVGAQPGAGKTLAARRARDLYPGECFVSINGDDLRVFHPAYTTLIKDSDPAAMPRETAQASGWWMRRALSFAASCGISTTVEGTFRNPGTTMDTIHLFSSHGFTVHVIALAVPWILSWQGCISRFVAAVERGWAARWSDMAAHDAGFAGTPQTVEAVENDPHRQVQRLMVMERSGETVFDNIRGDGGDWLGPLGAASLLVDRRRHLTPDDVNEFARFQVLLDDRVQRLALPPEVSVAVTSVRRVAVETFGAPVQAALEAAECAAQSGTDMDNP